MKSLPRVAIFGIIATGSALVSQTASAHHPTGGQSPTSLLHGVLSGIGHPIIGLDHFAFVVGIGLLAGIAGLGLQLPLVFVASMAAGIGLHLAGANVAHIELLVALSVVLIGVAVWRQAGRTIGWRECAAFALAGVLHGYALAETVIGAEPTPIAGYVAGLVVTQMTIAALAWQFSRLDLTRTSRWSKREFVTGAGLVIAAVGFVHVVLASTSAPAG